MTIERLDAGEDLAVVAAGNQNLCARADCSLEYGQGSSGELVLLDLSNFILAVQQLDVRIGLEGRGLHTSIQTWAWREAPCVLLADARQMRGSAHALDLCVGHTVEC